MNRRKGVPCGCDADPCGCSPKNHCVKKINGISSDPNGDFTVNAGSGIGIIGGENAITIVNTSDPDTFVEGKNIEFTPSGDDLEIGVVDDPVIDGTLTVNGDIIQNGAAYETHAEKVYTTNDYIVMRDGAVGGLAVGDYAGFQVEKYDGTNDGRLVIDRDGVARVGDVGDEQPLLTREESANLNNGALLKWDSTDQKAVDEGTVGSDTKPIKIVNGVATAVTDDLAKKSELPAYSYTIHSPNVEVRKSGKVVSVSILTLSLNTGTDQQILPPGTLPTMDGSNIHSALVNVSGNCTGLLYVTASGGLYANCYTAGVFFCSITYIANV